MNEVFKQTYKGVNIYRNTVNGMYSCSNPSPKEDATPSLRADTLAGIKEMITESLPKKATSSQL